MTFPTLVVCNAGPEKREQIETLVTNQVDLSLLETVSRETAGEEIGKLAPKLVWLELDPEPLEGITLLGTLISHHPACHFLVSYETLNADLVKASMQLGALDYLDAQTWHEQLADVIDRLKRKDQASPTAAKEQVDFSDVATHPSPIYSAPNSPKSERIAEAAEDVRWPIWVLPGLALIIISIFLILNFVR